MRNLPFLSGLAILAVVLNHANWHVLEQFAAPSWQVFFFIATDQICKFAVSAFIFVAGHFIAYATNGGKRDVQWSTVRARVIGLLWPWLIWSAVLVILHAFEGRPFSLVQYLNNLFIQYYFIPLLIVFYLVSPLFVRWLKMDLTKTLLWTGAIQLIAMALFYARIYLPAFPDALNSFIDIGPAEPFRYLIFFALGIVSGIYPVLIKKRLAPWKPWLPWILAGAYILACTESSLAFLTNGNVWPIGADQTKITSVLVSTVLILCFLAFDNIQLPYKRALTLLSKNSYGIYLTHYIILGVLFKLIEMFAPWLVTQYALLLIILWTITVAGCMVLLELTARLPSKRFYRYLFN
jgi:surface polysaccharide O-acyltransferase-like enzyme